MKKFTIGSKVLTLSLASVFIFASCAPGGGGAAVVDTPAPPAPVAAAADEPAAEPGAEGDGYTWDAEGRFRVFDNVQLTYRHVWNGGHRRPADQINNPVATAIRERIGVNVVRDGIMMNEAEHLNLMFAAMDFPDMINAPFWGGHGGETGIIKRAIADGLIFNLYDFLPAFPNIQRAYEIGVISQLFYERDIRDPMFETGGIYIIPIQTPGDEHHVTNWGAGIFVRGDVPVALGIDPSQIRTNEQLIDFMRAARDHGFYDIHGNPVTIIGTSFHDGWGTGDFLAGFSRQQRTAFVELPDGTLTHNTLTDLWVEQQLFMWRLVNEGLFDVEAFRHTGDQADEKVGNGRALFTGAHFFRSINATKMTSMYNAHPEMRFVPVGPLYDYNGNITVQFESYGRTGSHALFFPYNTSNILAALTYIDFMNTPEGMELATYGIEGVTFERNADGQPRLMPDLIEMRLAGDDRWTDIMLDVGAGSIHGVYLFADQRIHWFGELEPGEADAAIPELEEWRLRRPVVRRGGWPLVAFENEFPYIDLVRQTFWDGNPERDFRERAYFADTEAEARAILESWQEFLRTQQNGLFLDYVEFMWAQRDRRPDVVW